MLKKRMMLIEKRDSENSMALSSKIQTFSNGKSLIRQVTEMQTKARISLVDKPGLQSRARALSTISDYDDPKSLIKQAYSNSL